MLGKKQGATNSFPGFIFVRLSGTKFHLRAFNALIYASDILKIMLNRSQKKAHASHHLRKLRECRINKTHLIPVDLLLLYEQVALPYSVSSGPSAVVPLGKTNPHKSMSRRALLE